MVSAASATVMFLAEYGHLASRIFGTADAAACDCRCTVPSQGLSSKPSGEAPKMPELCSHIPVTCAEI